MAITNEQREMRRKHIGSSDAPAIMGVDPYRSAAEVWLEKTGRVEDFEGNEATERGVDLEPAILNWAERFLATPLARDVLISHPENILSANLDALAISIPAIVEAKSTIDLDGWGEPGTDQIPHRVNVQVHHQMLVAGPEYLVAYVPVMLPGYRKFDSRMYVVNRDDRVCNMIAEVCVRFWDRHVVTDTRPDDFRPSLEVLKRIRREPNKIIDIPARIAETCVLKRAAKVRAAKESEAADSLLLAALGDAEGATFEGGTLTYQETHRKGYTVEATKFRSLRIKQLKLEGPVSA